MNREWKIVRLSEFCRTGTGGTPSRSNLERYYEGGTIPWVKSGELRESVINKTEEHVTEAALNETNVKLVPAGALLLAMYGATVGRLGILGVEATTNQAVCHIIPNAKAADVRFMFHALSNQVSNLIARSVGGAQPNISQGIIKDLKLALPPLAEQRRIAEVLDRAEALRAKRRAALAQLDSLTQSLFLDLFGDPFKNPRGWPNFPFSEVCETTQGVQIPRDEQKEEPSEGYERYLYINDFYSDDSPKYIEDRFPQKRVTDDDLVMANTGSPGRVFKGQPGILSNNLFKITFDTKKISTVFFYHFLASDLFQRHLQGQMKQGIQSHLGHKTFGVQKLPLPPISLQREFGRRVTAVVALKTAQRASLAELDALFATLQHRAFKGEL